MYYIWYLIKIMKQFITILVTAVYLASIGGMPVEFHYCKGDLVSVSLFSSGNECCCSEEPEVKACCSQETSENSCHTESRDDCCTYEKLFVQYNKDNRVSETVKSNSIPVTAKLIYIHPSVTHTQPDTDSEESFCHDHPPPGPEPLWLLNCTFTFYG